MNHPWKVLEREAAALFGGKRHPANSGHRLDFESDTALGQCKLVKSLSLEALTKLAEEVERLALPKQKAGVVCVKVRRGKGRASPMLVVMTAAVYEAMNGKRSEQIGSVPSRIRRCTCGPPFSDAPGSLHDPTCQLVAR